MLSLIPGTTAHPDTTTAGREAIPREQLYMHTSLGTTTQAGTVEMLAVGFVTAMTDYTGNTIMAVTDDYRCLATNPAVIHAGPH